MTKSVISDVNNKGTDQSARLCSLASAFIVPCLGSIIQCIFNRFYLLNAFVAEQVSFVQHRRQTFS